MKRIIAVILCCVLCALLLSGCIKEGEQMFGGNAGRMVVVKIINGYEYIVEDSETGILYYMTRTSHGVGITPLFDKNGNVQSSEKYR